MRKLIVLSVVATLAVACKKVDSIPDVKGKLDGLAKTSLDYLPKDTMLVAGIDWKALRQSKFFQSGQLPPFVPDEARQSLDLVKTTCQIDPIAAVDSLVVTAQTSLEPEDDVAIVRLTVTKDQIAACLGQLGPALHHTIEAKDDGKLTEYDVDGKAFGYGAWIDANTLIATGASVRGDKKNLEPLLAASGGVRQNKAIMAVLEHVDTTATGWIAALPPKSDVIQELAGDLEGSWATISGVATIDINGGLHFGNSKDAAELYRKLSSEMDDLKRDPGASKFVSDVRVVRAGDDVRIAAHFSAEQLDALNELVKKLPSSILKKLQF